MSTDNEIRVVEIVETDFGEKAVIDSPFEAKDYMKFLPWKEYGEEVAEYGSLKDKARDRGINVKSSEMLEVFDAMEQYGFSDNLATHASWEPEALDGEGAWVIDVEALSEVADFWRFAGFEVENDTDVSL